jgi:cytochrome c oxidase subunit 3
MELIMICYGWIRPVLHFIRVQAAAFWEEHSILLYPIKYFLYDKLQIISAPLSGDSVFIFWGCLLIFLIAMWFDSITEESIEGYHNTKVNTDYAIGFVLFLLSEIMFFFSIFWAYFHYALSSSLEFGYKWMPDGIEPIPYMNLPFFNTLVLLTSGIFITWGYNAVKVESYDEALRGLHWTFSLACVFLIYQWTEYCIARFNINDSVYGSIFYFGTGFHGLHVLLGTIAILNSIKNLEMYRLSSMEHQSLEFTVWYWHFVDIVWLLLFSVFYVWGQL